jgi:hypothetical protein
MKKLSVLFLILMISFFSFQDSRAQSLRFGIGGGLSMVESPSYYTDGLGFSTEYHIGIKGKLELPVFPITPIGFVEYHFLNGSMDTPLGSVDTKQNILSIGVGGEFSFVPGPISPYLGVDLMFNNFGDLEAAGVTTSSGVSRMGIGVGAGAMLSLIIIDVDVSLKYQMMNLIGKDSGEETIGILNLNADIFF